MTHRFPIKEIARQAGLGTATVDRVLNGRAHVSPQTRNRVGAALRELAAQEQQLAARGRRLFVDVVVEAPRRFSAEIRRAADTILPSLAGAVIRPRFFMQEVMTETDVVACLARIQKRGSQAVCLKARDTAPVRDMVNRLVAAGIPVFTLVTDITGTDRQAYIGLDNTNAGRTAAYLLARGLPGSQGTVLTSRSQESFLGETERYKAFRALFGQLKPGHDIVDVSGAGGLSGDTERQLAGLLQGIERVSAVYSMGGGNAAIRKALADHGQAPTVYIAHDLDAENRRLLDDGAIDFILHHDLEADMRALFGAVASYHRLTPATATRLLSDVQVITPHNLPARSDRAS